ncbi:hypothetical protein RhiirA1_454919 [Rhizophagus irregularis]|uniref:Uncharacterized protein n=1 Tax=Rhizophagus irregularis TaxID=588596 RepID=A0A2N0S423_9GLOM|nr:hypothetical protein RhiirA1_454919 [Rhizophagus irregularis]
MDSFDLHSILTFQEDNMKLSLLCSNSYNNKMNTDFFSEFFNNNVNLTKPFNENFNDKDLFSYFELPAFNINFTDINISPNPEYFTKNLILLHQILNHFLMTILPTLIFFRILNNFLMIIFYFKSTSNLNSFSNYQYNLAVDDCFDDCNTKDKDSNNFTIWHKSYKYSSNGCYKAQKNIIKHLKTKVQNFNNFIKAFYLYRMHYMWRFLRLVGQKHIHYFNLTLECKVYEVLNRSIVLLRNLLINNASILCDVEKTINKRHEEEVRYCKLTDIKNLLYSDTIEDNFIKDVVDKLQITLKALLDGMNMLKIVET